MGKAKVKVKVCSYGCSVFAFNSLSMKLLQNSASITYAQASYIYAATYLSHIPVTVAYTSWALWGEPERRRAVADVKW